MKFFTCWRKTVAYETKGFVLSKARFRRPEHFMFEGSKNSPNFWEVFLNRETIVSQATKIKAFENQRFSMFEERSSSTAKNFVFCMLKETPFPELQNNRHNLRWEFQFLKWWILILFLQLLLFKSKDNINLKFFKVQC